MGFVERIAVARMLHPGQKRGLRFPLGAIAGLLRTELKGRTDLDVGLVVLSEVGSKQGGNPVTQPRGRSVDPSGAGVAGARPGFADPRRRERQRRASQS